MHAGGVVVLDGKALNRKFSNSITDIQNFTSTIGNQSDSLFYFGGIKYFAGAITVGAVACSQAKDGCQPCWVHLWAPLWQFHANMLLSFVNVAAILISVND